MTDVAANLEHVRREVADAARRAGRDPRAVRLIAVSKTKSAAFVERALAAGVTDLGENYVQEAAEKIPPYRRRATWHMIGHLQRNKAARALELFDVVHTIDSIALAETLARHAERRGQAARVLLEVNVGVEASKHGVAPHDVAGLLAALAALRWLEIDGLMTIPPPVAAAESARPYFKMLRELRDQLRAQAPPNAPLRELSMGMSDDFPVAIEEGATMVRVGRAIFGKR